MSVPVRAVTAEEAAVAAEPVVFRYRAILRGGLIAGVTAAVIVVVYLVALATGSHSAADPGTAVVGAVLVLGLCIGLANGIVRWRRGFVEVGREQVRAVWRGRPDRIIDLSDVAYAEQRWSRTYTLYAVRADIWLRAEGDHRPLLHVKRGSLTQKQALQFLLTVNRGIIDTGAVPRRLLDRRDAILAERRAERVAQHIPGQPLPDDR